MMNRNSSRFMADRLARARGTNVSETMVVAGLPADSKEMPSCILHEVHEPQTPTPATSASAS